MLSTEPLALVLITHLESVSTEALDTFLLEWRDGEIITDLCWINAQLACFQSVWDNGIESFCIYVI